jgi:hypothetical protein
MVTGASLRAGGAAELSPTPFSKSDGVSCPASSSCSIDFGTVPGGGKRRYEITHVSCQASISVANAKIAYWFLGASRDGNGEGTFYLRPHLNGLKTLPIATSYSANEQGFLVVRGGAQLTVRVARDATTAGTISGLNCTISGYDVRLQ